MNFASDNWAGATPEVMAAVARHNGGFSPAYGGDALTAAVTRGFCELFETEVEVHFTATGTAANALSMAAAAQPGGLIFCSAEAHLRNDEMGASEFFTGGMRVVPVAHRHGVITPEGLAAALLRYPAGGREGRPATLSLTQASEYGTLYQPGEIAVLAEMARARGMVVHMDGARFANAVAAAGTSPAAITWQAGIDIMSFGGTKNGCWAAEAIVVFKPGQFPHLPALRQRAGQVISKARLVAAQFEGYLSDGNWLRSAGHANAMAQRLAAGIAAGAQTRLGWETEANEVFAVLPKAVIARLREAGAVFYEWPAEGIPLGEEEDLVRLVTSWASGQDEVERFLGMV